MRLRQIHLDFHTCADIYDVGKNFDAESFAETLKAAHVNSVNIFAKCHHGMCYYPTKVGVQHPALDFDMLGQMIDALHRHDIRCPIYFPLGWEEDAANRADWLEIGKDGVLGGKAPFEDGHYRWRKLCLNNPDYLNYVRAQIAEILENYPVDGLWFDIIHQNGCLCPHCRKQMQALGLDRTNEADVKKHDEYVLKKMQTELNAFVRTYADVPIFYNSGWIADSGSTPTRNDRSLMQTHMEIESLPSGEWGYHHFPLLVNFHNRNNAPTVGMTGKFHLSWGDHGTRKNEEALEFECFRMVANGCACSIGDQLHPRGVLSKPVYARIGQVYETVEKLEPWLTDTTKVADIGVLISTDFYTQDTTADEGAVRILNELHYTFDLVEQGDDFAKYKLLILPDSVKMTDTVKQKLSSHLQNGGKVLATYKCADSVLGIDCIGENPYCPAYACIGEGLNKNVAPMEYVLYEPSVYVKTALPVLSKIGKPYFNRTYDRFSSHRHFPFEKETEFPAIVCGENVGYCAFALFTDYRKYANRFCRDVVQTLIEKLLPAPSVCVDAPTSLEMTMRKKGGKTMVHLLHYIPERRATELDIVDTKLPLYNLDVKVKADGAKRVLCVRSGEALVCKAENGYVCFTVPKVDGYEIICIEE